MFRKILVPVRGDGKGDNVFGHAVAIAKRFKAHIEVTHCRPRPDDMLPFGVPVPAFLKEMLVKQAGQLDDSEETRLHTEFSDLVVEYGLKEAKGPNGDGPTASWVEELGKQVDVIKLYGSMELAPLVGLGDLIVDVVDTGNTLRANGLEARDHICDVSSRLIVNQVSYKRKFALLEPILDSFKNSIANG